MRAVSGAEWIGWTRWTDAGPDPSVQRVPDEFLVSLVAAEHFFLLPFRGRIELNRLVPQLPHHSQPPSRIGRSSGHDRLPKAHGRHFREVPERQLLNLSCQLYERRDGAGKLVHASPALTGSASMERRTGQTVTPANVGRGFSPKILCTGRVPDRNGMGAVGVSRRGRIVKSLSHGRSLSLREHGRKRQWHAATSDLDVGRPRKTRIDHRSSQPVVGK